MKFTLTKPKMESILNLALLSGYYDKSELVGDNGSLWIEDSQSAHIITYGKFEQDFGFLDSDMNGRIVITQTLADALKTFDCPNVTLNADDNKIRIEGGSWKYEENPQQPTGKRFDYKMVDWQFGEIEGEKSEVFILPEFVANTIPEFAFTIDKEELKTLPTKASEYTFISKDGGVIVEVEQLGKLTTELQISSSYKTNEEHKASVFGAEFQKALSNFDAGEIAVFVATDFIILSSRQNKKDVVIGLALQAQGNIVV